ncbi:unnamed protein product [Cercospora beticola]|nr:unnamed protein product [Cercospora beticola]
MSGSWSLKASRLTRGRRLREQFFKRVLHARRSLRSFRASYQVYICIAHDSLATPMHRSKSTDRCAVPPLARPVDRGADCTSLCLSAPTIESSNHACRHILTSTTTRDVGCWSEVQDAVYFQSSICTSSAASSFWTPESTNRSFTTLVHTLFAWSMNFILE